MSGELRILPVAFTARRPQRMIERHIVAYRRQWLIIVSGFFEPLFYLLSMRAGLGNLVGKVSVAGTQVPYDAFVAPALMASSAMNGAILRAVRYSASASVNLPSLMRTSPRRATSGATKYLIPPP